VLLERYEEAWLGFAPPPKLNHLKLAFYIQSNFHLNYLILQNQRAQSDEWGCMWAMQINLVDWLKQMVGNRRSEEVADPSMEVKPTSRALKRALLVALRCVDPDALKRPKMGHVVHMLEAEEFPFRDVRLMPFIHPYK
jgi:hypothetical protein